MRLVRAGLSVLILADLLLGCGGQGSGPASSPSAASDAAAPEGPQGEASPAPPSLETGLHLFRKGDYKGAEPHLLGALKNAPHDRRILEALGTIDLRSDRFRQAEEN